MKNTKPLIFKRTSPPTKPVVVRKRPRKQGVCYQDLAKSLGVKVPEAKR